MDGTLIPQDPNASAAHSTAKAKRAKALEILTDSAETVAQTLVDMAKGDRPAKREQLDAVKTVLDRIGIIPPERSPDLGPKDLSALSTGELRALLSGVEDQLARQAKPVSATRIDTQPRQTVDMFD